MSRRPLVPIALLALVAIAASGVAILPIPSAGAAPEPPPAMRRNRAAVLPPGFVDEVVLGGDDDPLGRRLDTPTSLRFAASGRIYVAEKAGRVLAFDGIADATPTVVLDIRDRVMDFWDRGLLSIQLDPKLAAGRPYLYALYTLDAPIGGTPPRWRDDCPDPPGATRHGCVAAGRLSRFTIGSTGVAAASTERVLVEDWCQQFPGHSIADLAWARDGSLFASAGDSANFNAVDYGQHGSPRNPCGDAPGGVGGSMTAPSAEGGALRSQDVTTLGDPTSLDGSLVRIDPDTGAAHPANPLAGHADRNAARVVAHGFRNPFRLAVRPGTDEVWVADVGWSAWEEVNRVPTATITTAPANYGWPCFEGRNRQSSYEWTGLDRCTALYANGTHRPPAFSYAHNAAASAADRCPTSGTNGNSISGIAFARSGTYPASYAGGLFVADYARSCIWFLPRGADGLPDAAAGRSFVTGAAFPVHLEVAADGSVWYVDVFGGALHRIRATGAPVARIVATPRGGPTPLTVRLDATTSTDPDGGALRYAWDLDGDGAYDDATAATTSRTYTVAGTLRVGLRVTDVSGAANTTSTSLAVGAIPPTVAVTTDAPAGGWQVGTVVTFRGSARDRAGRAIPASGMRWTLVLNHCSGTPGASGGCHAHPLRSWTGVASGSFAAPDHEFPSHLVLTLTARDQAGVEGTRVVRLDPNTSVLTLNTNPSGLAVEAGGQAYAAPAVKRVITGSTVSIGVPGAQAIGQTAYGFASWSSAAPRAHEVVVPAGGLSRTATFTLAGTVAAPGHGVATGTWTGVPTGSLAAGTGIVTPSTGGPVQVAGGAPWQSTTLASFEARAVAEPAARYRAIVTPPASGRFTFWLAAAQRAQLTLTPLDGPGAPIAGRAVLARVSAAVASRAFDTRSEQRSAPTELVAGRRYLLEGWLGAPTAPGHLSVAWTGPGVPNRTVVPGSALSPAGTTGCSGWCPVERGLTVDTWTNRTGSWLLDIGAGALPNASTTVGTAAITGDRGADLGTRTRGWIVAPRTGTYTFWLSASESALVFLSPDANPARRLPLVRALRPTPVGLSTTTSVRSRAVSLVAGQRYWVEGFAKSGSGPEHLVLGWTGPGITSPTAVPGTALVPASTGVGCSGWCLSG